jgi:hypothetical protein
MRSEVSTLDYDHVPERWIIHNSLPLRYILITRVVEIATYDRRIGI